jgi:L,D-peptidoglycan transpeptidase YkuD (ErfK/YbiS/YcfS/YnhG family)
MALNQMSFSVVRPANYGFQRHHGHFLGPRFQCRCALGSRGITTGKIEGDGKTPAGRFSIRNGFFRPDRQPPPVSGISFVELTPNMGWCDDPVSRSYNQAVTLPFSRGAEGLWRNDRLYDLILVLGYNDDPPIAGAGSAIFIHVAAPGLKPTRGCVALPMRELKRLIGTMQRDSLVVISQKPMVRRLHRP